MGVQGGDGVLAHPPGEEDPEGSLVSNGDERAATRTALKADRNSRAIGDEARRRAVAGGAAGVRAGPAAKNPPAHAQASAGGARVSGPSCEREDFWTMDYPHSRYGTRHRRRRPAAAAAGLPAVFSSTALTNPFAVNAATPGGVATPTGRRRRQPEGVVAGRRRMQALKDAREPCRASEVDRHRCRQRCAEDRRLNDATRKRPVTPTAQSPRR